MGKEETKWVDEARILYEGRGDVTLSQSQGGGCLGNAPTEKVEKGDYKRTTSPLDPFLVEELIFGC